MQLSGKLSIVTGGGGGFGQEISLTLARAGSAIAVVDMDEERAEEVAGQVREAGGQAQAYKVDITSIPEITELMERVKKRFQRIDILVNNAGVTLGKPVEEVTEQDWCRVMDINLKGTFFMAQAAGREMIIHGGGNIVNIASINYKVAEINTAVYSTSKTGIVAITRNLAREWARHNIRVNAVAPGYARTPLTEFVMEQEKILNAFLRQIPLRRLCTPQDVAEAVLYLVSDAAAYVIGHVLSVDGGRTII